jgi:Fur family ferric uptake transcriptional regulator
MAKEIKLKNTKQLAIILGVLKTTKQPISAVDLLAIAQKKAPALNKTTVYRTLDKLTQDGTVDVVMLHEGVLHYELRTHESHHHHFVCLKCDTIYCISGCVTGLNSLVPNGFSLNSHEVTLRGICKRCN